MMIELYAIYLLVSMIILAIFNWRNKLNIVIKTIIVAFLPLVGWFLPIVWWGKPMKHSEKQFSDYVESQQQEHSVRRIGIYNYLEKKKELDIVPIEDALVVSQHQDRRKVMLDVLKQDTINYIEILQRAVSNEDTETSHYAVSAIMEMKRKLLLSMQELSVKYEHEQYDIDVVIAYVEVLQEYLQSGFLDQRTLRKYQFTYLSVLTHLNDVAGDLEWVYAAKIEIEIKLGLVVDAEATAKQYLKVFPQSEEAYLLLLKIYFITRSKNQLNGTLESLKNSNIKLSNEALTTVRFWSEGEHHG